MVASLLALGCVSVRSFQVSTPRPGPMVKALEVTTEVATDNGPPMPVSATLTDRGKVLFLAR